VSDHPFGARPVEGGVRFSVWAPTSQGVAVVVEGGDAHALTRSADGTFAGVVPGVSAGARYRYRLDGGDAFPDPASLSQPEGVHGPSEVVSLGGFEWRHEGERLRHTLSDLVIYELHVGTFTPTGTFDAAIDRLPYLADLGVSAVEVMPIAEFPGCRNWGYDGVYLYAPARVYGGIDGFRRFVDAAHGHGLSVILDVVYNHFGPEGNYLHAITGERFFTDRHETPWGAGINFDGEGSGLVRRFFVENALYWATEYHVDGFRFDATHAIVDDSPVHIVQEIAERLRDVRSDLILIAEDERNERRLVTPAREGGFGLDAVWADDLHHQVRRLAAGDREGYFADYAGTTEDLATTLRKGWFYEGQRSDHLGEPRGTPAEGIAPPRFVHCIQNHDQVGNRAMGDRLTESVQPDLYRALSALLLLSPYTPLLWMGQEWAATTPFLYFTDHPEELGRLVTEGRRNEFRHFSAFSDPAVRARIPDPQSEETFTRSRLDWSERERGWHAGVHALYADLLAMRREEPALQARSREAFQVAALGPAGVALRRHGPDGSGLVYVASLRNELRIDIGESAVTAPPAGGWRFRLATEASRYGGDGGWGRLEADGTLHLERPGGILLTG
jgi:maltooligosyltrehalose trehalohydrolase